MVNLKQFKDVPVGAKFRFIKPDNTPSETLETKDKEKHGSIAPDTLVAVEAPLKQKKPPKAPPKKSAKAKASAIPPAVQEELEAARKIIADMRKYSRNRAEPSGLVRITRSFSFKLNLGQYQSADFFCSQSVQCKAEDAEAKSLAVIAFCKAQTQKDIAAFKEELRTTKQWPQSMA